MGKKLFWNSLIEVTFESYLMVCLCELITLKNRIGFSGFGESLQTSSALVVIAYYILIPSIALIGILANFSLTTTHQMSDKYGKFYEGLVVKKGKRFILIPIYFLARRLYLSYLVIAAGTSVFVFQMM